MGTLRVIRSAVKFVVYLILFFFSLASPASAQSLTLNIAGLNSANGLSQNSIQCIFKDSYGLMWFGTLDGLNKYDGFKFTVYKHSSNNPGSLPANNITAICEDGAGN